MRPKVFYASNEKCMRSIKGRNRIQKWPKFGPKGFNFSKFLLTHPMARVFKIKFCSLFGVLYAYQTELFERSSKMVFLFFYAHFKPSYDFLEKMVPPLKFWAGYATVQHSN